MSSTTLALVKGLRAAKLEKVLELLDKVEDVNALSSEGDSPLVTCAMLGRADVLARLLSAGASADAACASGMSALAAASLSGHLACVRKLLEAGATVDQLCGLSQSTALIHAATQGHRAVCEALIEAGADPKLEDAYGTSAIEHAKRRDVDATRMFGEWERWADQIKKRAAAIEAEPAPMRPPFAYKLKADLQECHKEQQSTNVIWRGGEWIHQKRPPSEAVVIQTREKPFNSTGYLQPASEVARAHPGGTEPSQGAQIPGTEPVYERVGALSNFGLLDNAIEKQPFMPQHMGALAVPDVAGFGQGQGLALAPDYGKEMSRAAYDRAVANPEFFFDDVKLTTKGIRAAVLDAVGTLRDTEKQDIYLNAAFPGVPTRHGSQPLYAGHQLQSRISVDSAASTLTPVLEPPSKKTLVELLSTPKRKPETEEVGN